jgi:hypothetical protein
VHASTPSLPAATEYETPESIDACSAVSRTVSASPPRLMFATAGLIACAVTHSMPETTLSVVPNPSQSRTRTATSWTPLATP